MPERPARQLSQNSSTELPFGAIAPSPVTAIRRLTGGRGLGYRRGTSSSEEERDAQKPSGEAPPGARGCNQRRRRARDDPDGGGEGRPRGRGAGRRRDG